MSQSCSGILTSQSQTPSQRKNRSTEFFKKITHDSGIILTSDDSPNVITQEQSLVVRDLEKNLSQTPTEIENFIKGFKVLINKDKYFVKALTPTQLKKSDTDRVLKIEQESLCRLFLKVDKLQGETIEIVLDKLTSILIGPDWEINDNNETPWLKLLLSQLCYLPHIQNGEVLSEKLLDIIEISPLGAQLEILNSIPEILPDSEYNKTAKTLSSMLDQREELTGAIIDCLNALNLDSEIRSQVQDHILSKIAMGASVKIFPILIEFLMSDYKAQNLPNTFLKIRNALDSIMGSGDLSRNTEKESAKIVIFKRLKALTTAPKQVSDAWLTVINNIKVHKDHKPIDLLLLIMLHKTVKLKKRNVEMIIRKKVKDGVFKCDLVERLFSKYLLRQLLMDYFSSIVEIGCSLLRTSNETTVNEFASVLFKSLFKCQYIETTFRQEMLENLVLLAAVGDQKITTPILNIFISLLDDDKIKLHTIVFMRLLEKIDVFELKDVKLVFEILCSITCSDENLSGFKQELHILIRKQLTSPKRDLKHRGIVSAVVMAKHIARNEVEQSEMSETSITDAASLRGEAKEAALLLELVNSSVNSSLELLGLYYDQLAAMLIKTDDLGKTFMTWLYDTFTNDFQAIFITENACDSIDELEFSMQHNLNSKEEIDNPIAIDIAELTLKNGKISILAPHFRLLRLLHYRQQNGDLSSIDALLGCSVVLPNYENADALDNNQIKQVTDCLFHCINWFREVISGFVTQKNRQIRHKVIQRLANLIDMEKVLIELLTNIPDHRLPNSYFDAIPTKKQILPPKPSKPLKKKQKPNETNADTTSTPGPASNTQKKKPGRKPTNIREDNVAKFREMDTDIVRLMKYPLNSDETEEVSDSAQITITVNQLNFILGDFVTKLSFLTQGRNLGLLYLNVVVPEDLVSDCVQILPNVSKHFTVVCAKIRTVLSESGQNSQSTVLFNDEMNEYKLCFGLVLECLRYIFSWSGFQHASRLELLRNVLRSFINDESITFTSANRLVMELINRLVDVAPNCLILDQAVSLIKTMEALNNVTVEPEIRIKIAKTSRLLLSKDWYNCKGVPESGKNKSLNIDVLVKAYLSSANVKTINGLVGTLEKQVTTLEAKDDCLQMLASVDKANFYILYRNLWSCLHENIKKEIQSLTNNQHLTLWRTVALTMQGLMLIAKHHETKSNLVCFLKKSIAILKIFLTSGIAMLEIMLKSKPDQVVEILKSIQTTTRYLHHLCCFSKLKKDTSLMAYVPQFRFILESLVHRVKAALVANGCSSAFWMGNLKNRDLHGEDILSQSTIMSVSNQEESEDEELPEDESSDEDIGEDSNAEAKSGSEVFD